jgi:hypothetical protein
MAVERGMLSQAERTVVIRSSPACATLEQGVQHADLGGSGHAASSEHERGVRAGHLYRMPRAGQRLTCAFSGSWAEESPTWIV